MTVRALGHRILYRLTRPPVAPARQLLIYYVLLALALAALVWAVPGAGQLLGVGRLAELAAASPRLLDDGTRAAAPPPSVGLWGYELGLGFALLGSLLLMLPVSWVYMATQREKGFEKSVVQALLLLPLAVASVIVVVQHSLALAFGLAAVVAAVRFRNALKQTSDALYLFVAIAVGLAVGVQAFVAAGIMSLLFNFVTLALWRCGYGEGSLPGVSVDPAEHSEAANNGRQGQLKLKKKKQKKWGFGGVLAIQAWTPEPAQRLVENVLSKTAKRWQLDEIVRGKNGKTTIRYMVRLGSETPAESLVQTVIDQGAPSVLSATLS